MENQEPSVRKRSKAKHHRAGEPCDRADRAPGIYASSYVCNYVLFSLNIFFQGSPFASWLSPGCPRLHLTAVCVSQVLLLLLPSLFSVPSFPADFENMFHRRAWMHVGMLPWWRRAIDDVGPMVVKRYDRSLPLVPMLLLLLEHHRHCAWGGRVSPVGMRASFGLGLHRHVSATSSPSSRQQQHAEAGEQQKCNIGNIMLWPGCLLARPLSLALFIPCFLGLSISYVPLDKQRKSWQWCAGLRSSMNLITGTTMPTHTHIQGETDSKRLFLELAARYWNATVGTARRKLAVIVRFGC